MSYFICGQPNWPILASMFMCLWTEVTDAATQAGVLHELGEWVRTRKSSVAQAAAAYRTQHGFCPHPWNVMAAAGWTPTA